MKKSNIKKTAKIVDNSLFGNVFEQFEVGNVSGRIYKKNDQFKAFYNGGGISDWVDTIEKARLILFLYITARYSERISEAHKLIEGSQDIMKRLGTDPFNLGKFKVDDDKRND